MNIYKNLKSAGYLFGEKRYIKFLSYNSAKNFIKKYKFKSEDEFHKYQKNNNLRLKGIPSNCARVYSGKGWKGWPDFLGHGNVATFRYKDAKFEEVRKIVRELNIPTKEKYKPTILSNKLKIPLNPEGVFKNKGWISWSDFLGSKKISNYEKKKLRWNFYKARDFVRKLKFKSEREWRIFASSKKRPVNVPSNASKVYKDEGWKGWPDFLGNKSN